MAASLVASIGSDFFLDRPIQSTPANRPMQTQLMRQASSADNDDIAGT
jgi:hypothetical protein